jgi:putative nucleotidyltransferase-like protein
MHSCASNGDDLDPRIFSFYCTALKALQASQVPFLVGGAYALASYTGIVRHTKDIDIFTRPKDCVHVLKVLSEIGCRTEITDPRWLAKAFSGEEFIDVIFSSGNGIAEVDDLWFEHAPEAKILGLSVRLCPPEETIWSKAFVMERERYDGADVAHLLRACGDRLDWKRLLDRFNAHWRVLLSHLILFGFSYPAERGRIPPSVMETLLDRLKRELHDSLTVGRLCQGTLLSRAQYVIDIDQWGYQDARLLPSSDKTVSEAVP